MNFEISRNVCRRFVEAVKVQPRGKRGLADEAVAMIGKLYSIERDYKDADDAAGLLARQQHSLPALAALRTWLDKTVPGVTPKSALGTALSYLRDYSMTSRSFPTRTPSWPGLRTPTSCRTPPRCTAAGASCSTKPAQYSLSDGGNLVGVSTPGFHPNGFMVGLNQVF